MVNFIGGLWFSTIGVVADWISRDDDQIKSTDLIFKLHTTVTLIILVLGSGLLQLVKFSGAIIDCFSGSAGSLRSVATSYCWVSGETFILKTEEAWSNQSIVNGLGHDHCHSSEASDCKFQLSFYQWTAWILVLQAFIFYVPRWLWNIVEARTFFPIIRAFKEVEVNDRGLISELCNDLVERKTFYSCIAVLHVFLESLNFANCLVNIFLLDFFFGSFNIDNGLDLPSNELRFKNYGWTLLQFLTSGSWGEMSMSTSPAYVLFPRLTKCDFPLIGVGGGDRKEQFVCLLFLNNINDKVFALVWIWLHLLAAIGGLKVLFSVLSAAWGACLARKWVGVVGTVFDDEGEEAAVKRAARQKTILIWQLPIGLRFMLATIKLNSKSHVYTEAEKQLLLLQVKKPKAS